MSPQMQTFARRALWLLPIWTALLFLSTLTHQPDPQTEFAAFAARSAQSRPAATMAPGI